MLVGIVTVPLICVMLSGCDSTPPPPTDVPPSVSKDAPPANSRVSRKSVKNRPPAGEAAPTTPTP